MTRKHKQSQSTPLHVAARGGHKDVVRSVLYCFEYLYNLDIFLQLTMSSFTWYTQLKNYFLLKIGQNMDINPWYECEKWPNSSR